MPRDPLPHPGFSPTAAVRDSCRHWIETRLPDGVKTTVSVDHDALDKFADELARSILSNQSLEVTEWDAEGWHYTGRVYRKADRHDDDHELMKMERVALYVLSLDAVNFCFWPLSSEIRENDIAKKNGLEYEHLAVALRKVAEEDDDLPGGDRQVGDAACIVRAASSYALSPTNLSTLTPEKLNGMLHPHFPPASVDTHYELPDTELRCQLLRELGTGLLQRHDGSALNMIAKANGSADALVSIILDTFPGFRDYVDTSRWNDPANLSHEWQSVKSSGSVIHFYKRAQIAVADIWAALGRHQSSSPVRVQFGDIELLTTFPDYRIPQILRHAGVIKYVAALENLIDNELELEKGGVDEISIRAGTVVAIEEVVQRVRGKISTAAIDCKRSRRDLQRLADDVSAATIDWMLWQRGEKLDRLSLLEPHHRVRTTFY